MTKPNLLEMAILSMGMARMAIGEVGSLSLLGGSPTTPTATS